MDLLHDTRVNCYSIIDAIKVKDYLLLVEKAYKNRGGIEGQREALKTNTALRIRKRLVEDLSKGAVLPPLVLGVIFSDEEIQNINNLDLEGFRKIIQEKSQEGVNIIDGMQRTTALYEANRDGAIADKVIRVEYWIAPNIASLIYRMLVLNTGQVPWNLRRQMEVVFREMIKEIKAQVKDLDVLEIKDKRRRAKTGQFQADQLIELFLVFSSRKTNVDAQEKLADELIKLDVIEKTGEENFVPEFYQALQHLTNFDNLLGKYDPPVDENDVSAERFAKGMDLFSSQPARVGFIAAIAERVMGRPGMSYDEQRQNDRWTEVNQNIDRILSMLEKMEPDNIKTFLDFETLVSAINVKSGKVGEFEREFFKKAFLVFIEEDQLESMTPCWRAP